MALVLTEEQSLLKETANEFLQKNAPITEFRKLRDEGKVSAETADKILNDNARALYGL